MKLAGCGIFFYVMAYETKCMMKLWLHQLIK